MKKCIIIISNKKFISKTIYTIKQIRKFGKYNDDIIILVDEELIDFKTNLKNVFVKYFPKIDRKKFIEFFKNNPISDGREIHKSFQFHKIHAFDVFFKQWTVCLLLDSGMHIFKPINPIFHIDYKDSIIAHSDAYPTFERKLYCQFDSVYNLNLFKKLQENYNLSVDYFQTGFMLFDTSIINDDTKNILINLSNEYYISKTNEQGIFNLYFNIFLKKWKPLNTNRINNLFFYDYWERDNHLYNEYIMLKYPQTITILMKFNNFLNEKFGYSNIIYNIQQA